MFRSRIIAITIIAALLISSCSQQTKKEYWPDGTLKSEIHLKGTIYDGKATWWYENGIKQMECHYKKNQLDSILTRWFPNGKKQEEQHYRENKKNGVNRGWDIEGNKIFEQFYYNGILNGTFKEWHPNKELKMEGQYRMGKLDGKWLYYDNSGIIIGYGTFSNGDGMQKAFYENGNLKTETSYINNLKEGVEKIYDITGKLKEARIYKAGVLQGTSK
jgi:antitoxin component YwqK of YwqJK toxin-antitoxin module